MTVPHLNHATRQITCTAVYCGPAGAGKSTSLRYLGGRARSGAAPGAGTGGEALSLELGTISGYAVRFQLYALPSDAADPVRMLMLNGADGLVFVADSRAVCFDSNRGCFEKLTGAIASDLPVVVQCNKQDLPSALLVPADRLAAALAPGRPGFPSDALHGAGVYEAFAALSGLVMARFA